MGDPDEPVWDASGTDPWLPDRLAAMAEVAAAELAIYEIVWEELSAWIVSVARSVLSGGLVDPHGVYARTPAWAEATRRIVTGPITDTLGISYRALFGDHTSYESRPAVQQHLATVTNRMAATPDSVFDLIAAEVSRGANAGEGAQEIRGRVASVLSTTDTPRWTNRALVVARTETIGALNAGKQDAFAQLANDLQQPFEQIWVSTLDGRTRDTHRRADGQRVPTGTPFQVGGASLRFPGDPLGPGRETIQCRCTTILVEPGEDVDVSHRPVKS